MEQCPGVRDPARFHWVAHFPLSTIRFLAAVIVSRSCRGAPENWNSDMVVNYIDGTMGPPGDGLTDLTQYFKNRCRIFKLSSTHFTRLRVHLPSVTLYRLLTGLECLMSYTWHVPLPPAVTANCCLEPFTCADITWFSASAWDVAFGDNTP